MYEKTAIPHALNVLAQTLVKTGAIAASLSGCSESELAGAETLGLLRSRSETCDGEQYPLLIAGPALHKFQGVRRAPPVPGRALEMAFLAADMSKFRSADVLIAHRRHAYVTRHPTIDGASIMVAARLCAPAARTLERMVAELFVPTDMSDLLGDVGADNGRILWPLAELIIHVPPRQLELLERRRPENMPRGVITPCALNLQALKR